MCKNCGSLIEHPLSDTNIMGISNFCSVQCYKAYNRIKSKGLIKNVTQEPKQPKSKERFKKLSVEEPPIVPYQGKKLDKDILDRSEDYSNFIRSFACLVCNVKEVHAAHLDTGGTGIKGTDFSQVPLCAEHHINGNKCLHKLGEKKFNEMHGVDLRKCQASLLIQFIRLLLQNL
jgi:hypothetical protein